MADSLIVIARIVFSSFFSFNEQALCAAVVTPDVLETMALLFSGADAMCATGDPMHSTPYLLAKKAGQSLQMEFLHHNKFSGRSCLFVSLVSSGVSLMGMKQCYFILRKSLGHTSFLFL